MSQQVTPPNHDVSSPITLNPRSWVDHRWRSILAVSLLCFAILGLGCWFNRSATYGNFYFSFNSPAVGINFSVSYRKGRMYISFPELEFSKVIPKGRIRALGRKYIPIIRITGLIVLFLCGLALPLWLIVNWRMLRESWGLGLGYFKEQGIIGIVLHLAAAIIFIASIFPLPALNYWLGWGTGAGYQPETLARLLYGALTQTLLNKQHKLFYALLFTLPGFFLQWVGVAGITLVLLAKFSLPERLSARCGKWAGKLVAPVPLYLILLCSLVVFGISFSRMPGLPLTPAAVAHYFQARLFASGRLLQEMNISWEFFTFPFLQNGLHRFSLLPPGYPLVLAPGVLARLPRLVNPILGALVLLLLYECGRRLYDPKVAVVGLSLGIISPLFWNFSSTFQPGIMFAFCFLLFLYSFSRLMEKPALVWAGLAGGSFSLGFAAVPVATLGLTLPFLAYLLYRLRRQVPALLTLWGSVSLGIWGFFNYYYKLLEEYLPWSATSPAQLLKQDLRAFSFQLSRLNQELIPWFIPPLFLLLLWIVTRRSKNTSDELLLSALIGLVAVQFLPFNLWPKEGNALLLGLPLFILLLSRGILALPDELSQLGFSAPRVRDLLVVVLLFSTLGGPLPKLVQLLGSPADKGDELSGALLAQHLPASPSVVFLEEELYLKVFVYNAPDLRGRIVYARDLGAYNTKLMSELPDRQYFKARMQNGKLQLIEAAP